MLELDDIQEPKTPHGVVYEELREQLRARPDYIIVGTPGPAGPEAWATLEPMKSGTKSVTTVWPDWSGFTTYQDGTVVQLTAEEVLAGLGYEGDGDEA